MYIYRYRYIFIVLFLSIGVRRQLPPESRGGRENGGQSARPFVFQWPSGSCVTRYVMATRRVDGSRADVSILGPNMMKMPNLCK